MVKKDSILRPVDDEARGIAQGLLGEVRFAALAVIASDMPFVTRIALGVVLGLAMIANLLAAGMAGIMVPITFHKMGADPALASGAFVTAVTDIVGFLPFSGWQR